MRGKLLVSVLGFGIVLLSAWFFFMPRAVHTIPSAVPRTIVASSTEPSIRVAGNLVHIAIADTPAAKEKGLSGRDDLAPDEGMLFVFEEDSGHPFWMKDMNFSIDMLWISSEGTIVHIAPNVSPETYPQTFSSPVPSRYVLELSANYAAEHNLKIGDKVQI